ncbi:MAG TPA: primosomal protein N' [Burkholderiales bacterium]|nr:primosomal protein N' [Burkholderiales bacterium]
MPKPPGIYRIAVPAPLYQFFDYLAPADSPPAVPGMRVRVPFGRREAVGILMETASDTALPRSRLRSASAVLDAEPLLPSSLLKLLIWAANYYHHPVGEVLHAAMPVLLRQGRPAVAAGERVWRATAPPPDAKLTRAPAQQRVLTALRAAPGLREHDLAEVSPRWRTAVRALAARGFVAAEQTDCLASYAGPYDAPPTLSAAQRNAADAIHATHGFRCLLLHGVTGSGKTEVYLHAIDRILAQGRQVLVLVPEIGLTPQLLARFRRRFAVPIAVLHSGLTEQERLCAWLSARAGRAAVVIGTRSAVFAPFADLGLIVVDEEHDGSFKQQEGFRYHARDVAVMRASRDGVPVVLGSATPSLESLRHARDGTYTLLDLPDRAGGAGMPAVRLLDMRRLKPDQGLSPPLREAIAARLARAEQTLLFLNRRGFAPVWMCHACGWIVPCTRCDARLTYHKGSGKLRCHHCNLERPLVEQCSVCAAPELHPLGEGTERVEAALTKYFPGARIERIDRDSTRRKGMLEEKLERVHAGCADILIGTQMLTKGHDFPNVTLVGVLNADQGLYSADFRAGERLFQQILQVSGRAGRADKPGEVVIQTWHPQHPIFNALARHDYGGFADFAFAERRDTCYPPYSFLALLRAEATKPGVAMGFLGEARQAACRLERDGKIELGEPAPAPMERRGGRYRAQLLVQAAERKTLHVFLDAWLARLAESKLGKRVRWSLDVDPIDLF